MKCYHLTTVENAERILKDGFEDSTDEYMMKNKHMGVWLSDIPLNCGDGIIGDIVFKLDIPEEVFATHEWVGEKKAYREALLPAEKINRYGPPVVTQSDWDGFSRSDVAREADMNVDQEATRLREVVIPFLERHNLLAPEEE